MRLAPGVKPARIKFAADQRAGRLEFADLGKIIRHVAAEISRLEQIREQPVFHLVRRVALEQRHVKTSVNQGFPDFVHILRVLAEEAVFVLDLRHDDRAAVRDLQRAELAADLLEIGLRRSEIARVAAAKPDAVVLEHPPRRAAHFPFGAGIRAGPEDDPQALLLRDAAEFRVVRLAAPIKFSRPRLVQIPEEIRADGVQAHGFCHLQTLAPIRLGHARGVDFAAADLDFFSVEEKIIRADGEGVLGPPGIFCGAGRGDEHARQRCQN